jgi:cyclopropane fatty-acyl-phospholipid synthase-like methyltransferase
VAGRFQFANEQEVEIFSKGVEVLTAASARVLPEAYDFGRHRRVLDLGGGTGSYLLPLLQQYPSLNATLFELPRVAEVAERVLKGHPLASRIQIVAGDMLGSPIPPGHDAIIIADVIHTLSAEHNLEMFASLRKSVDPGARVLLVDLFTNPSHTEPVAAAILAAEFMIMTGEGDVYSQQEAEQWLRETGWTPMGFKLLSGPRSLLAAEAAALRE